MNAETEVTEFSNIGAALTKAREEKGISITTAAMQTNLSAAVIEQLENNRFSEMGAEVYVKGNLDKYTRYLGLEKEQITQLFKQQYSKSPTTLRLNSANIASQTRSYKRSLWLTWAWFLALLVVLLMVLLQVFRQDSWLMRQIRGAFAQESSVSSEVAQAPTNEAVIALESVGDSGLRSESVSDYAPTTVVERDQATENKAEITLESSDMTVVEKEQAAVTAPVELAPAFSAGIEVLAENWIEVRDKRNKIVASKVYRANERIELSLEHAPYALHVGRPTQIRFVINGVEQDLSKYKNRSSNQRFTLNFGGQ